MTTKLVIKFTEEESCTVATAHWRGSMRDILEQHFRCTERDEHIVRLEVDEHGVQAFVTKGPRRS